MKAESFLESAGSTKLYFSSFVRSSHIRIPFTTVMPIAEEHDTRSVGG